MHFKWDCLDKSQLELNQSTLQCSIKHTKLILCYIIQVKRYSSTCHVDSKLKAVFCFRQINNQCLFKEKILSKGREKTRGLREIQDPPFKPTIIQSHHNHPNTIKHYATFWPDPTKIITHALSRRCSDLKPI